MREEHVYFKSGDLMLEGVIHWPESDGQFPGIVVCHPHSLYGGDMDNNVVLTLSKALAEAQIVAMRFNFRGVGNSEGSYGDGVSEQEDVKSAISFLQAMPEIDAQRTALAGYSFGAYVGLAAARDDKRITAVAAISPPLELFDFTFAQDYQQPKLLVVGQRDSLVPLNIFAKWTESLSEPKTVKVIPSASHFWIGHELELSNVTIAFFKPLLGS